MASLDQSLMIPDDKISIPLLSVSDWNHHWVRKIKREIFSHIDITESMIFEEIFLRPLKNKL
jgi:hypothetical protein